MDPLNPWLDADEVRRMALRLIKPVGESTANIADAGFGETFIGFAPPDAATALRRQDSPAPAPANRDNPPMADPAVTPASAPPSLAAPMPAARMDGPVSPKDAKDSKVQPSSSAIARGHFLERIRRFRDWLEKEFSAAGVFILDREGSVIFDESELGRLHFLARSLALASRRPGTSAANVHVKIGAGTTLEVIPVETAYGCMVLGAVVPEALTPASVGDVMEALVQVAAPNA
jgi:hypothetical protein